MSFQEKVERGLLKALEAADKSRCRNFLLSLSGGADSTALLLAMREICLKRSWELQACHVNHQLRGDESRQDEEFCRKLCADLQIPLEVRRLALVDSGNNEAAWRDARYKQLLEVAAGQAAYVVLGHTLDDQAETLLFRWFRGSGARGLSGIPETRKLSNQVYLLRPLLQLSHGDCLKFLQEKQVQARQDSSNLNVIFARNYIRRRIIPPIAERFADFAVKMEQTRQILSAEDRYLEEIAQRQTQLLEMSSGNENIWDLVEFRPMPLALQRRLVAAACAVRQVEVSFKLVEELLRHCLQGGDTAVSLNERWDFQVSRQRIIWHDKSLVRVPVLNNPQEFAVKLPGLTPVLLWQKALRIETYDSEELNFPPAQAAEALVDLSEVKLPLVLRTRRAGDVIRPFGMRQKVGLKKYLHTHKSDRVSMLPGHLAVLCDQDEVLWIPGVGLSNLLRVKRKATHRLAWMDLSTDAPDIC